jgi:hypothetical protein
MTKEQIEKYERLVLKRHDITDKIKWLNDWGENLYGDLCTGEGPREDERFYITITRWDNGKVVLQRDTTREVAEAEFNAEMMRLDAELKRIEKEIAEL